MGIMGLVDGVFVCERRGVVVELLCMRTLSAPSRF